MEAMKTIYDNKLGTTIKRVLCEQAAIDYIKSSEGYDLYIVSTPNRVNAWWYKAAAINDIKQTCQYAEIVNILTVNKILIVEY